MTTNGNTLTATVSRLAQEREARLDVIVDTGQHVDTALFSTDPDPLNRVRLVLDAPEAGLEDGLPFRITRHAHKQVAADAGIPWTYYERMLEKQPGLVVPNLETWWNAEPSARMARLLRPDAQLRSIIGDDRMRAWMSRSYKVVDNYDFLLAALDAVTEFRGSVKQSNVDDERLYVRVVTPRTATLSKGEVVQQGVEFRNSEVGDGSVQVVPFVLVLACTNGMTLPQKFRAIHLGSTKDEGILSEATLRKEAEAILGKIGDWTRYVLDPDRFGEIIDRFDGARDQRIDVPARRAVANVVRAHSFTQAEADAILERFLRQDDDSRFGMIGAVTYVAHQEGTPFRRQAELEAVGGQLLDMADSSFRSLVNAKVSDRAVERAFSAN